MTLVQAQRAITTNWVALAPIRLVSSARQQHVHVDYGSSLRTLARRRAVIVTDAAGRTATWHTDASGYADVYFHAPAQAAGDAITASVGGASCQTAL
jgi:accessory colonization factor AcfC